MGKGTGFSNTCPHLVLDVIIAFYNHYYEICDKEILSNRIFAIIYVLGAVVSGIGMYFKKKKEMKEDNST